jgi:hypothetical protein
MSKEDIDVEKEIERISRKTCVNIMKSENHFESRLNQLDEDIDKLVKSKEKFFDESKEVTTKYLTTDYTESSLERYRKKLNKI